MDYDIKERLVILETQFRAMHKDLLEHADREETNLERNLTLLAEIKEEHERMKGFFGGVVLVISAIGALLGMIFHDIFNK